MYTGLDKALVALVMAIIGIVGAVYKPFNVDPTIVVAIISALTPVLVYLFPNLPKDPTS